MSRNVLGVAAAVAFATMMVNAQGTTQEPVHHQAGSQSLVTIEGCLDQGQRAQAESPATTVPEAEGTFVLKNAQMKTGRAPAASASSTSAERSGAAATGTEQTGTQAGAAERPAAQAGTETGRAVGTSGVAAEGAEHTAASYKIVGLPDDRLQAHTGQRVRLQGQIEKKKDHDSAGVAAGATATAGAQQDSRQMAAAGDMKEFRATSIERVPGTCPASR